MEGAQTPAPDRADRRGSQALARASRVPTCSAAPSLPRAAVSVSWTLVDRVFEIPDLHATDRLVLMAICRHAKDEGTGAYPSTVTLGRETGLTTRAVREALKHLSMHGYITVKHRDRDSNLYTVTLSEGVSCTTRTKCIRGERGSSRAAPRSAKSVSESVRDESVSDGGEPRSGYLTTTGRKIKRLRKRSVTSPSSKTSSSLSSMTKRRKRTVSPSPTKVEPFDYDSPELPTAAFMKMQGAA